MHEKSPRNPKGAGRKLGSSPNPSKVMQTFWCDPAIAEKLKSPKDIGFKNKAELINFALKFFFDTYRAPPNT